MDDGMTKTKILRGWLPDLGQAALRFPLPFVISIIACGYSLFVLIPAEGYRYFDSILALAAAFIAGGIGHLFIEGRGGSRSVNLVAASLCALAAWAVIQFYAVFQPFEAMFFAGLTMMLFVAAYLNSQAKQSSFWFFSVRLALAGVLAVIVGVVVGVGLSAIVAGLDFLFGIRLGNKSYEYIWAVAITLVGPIFGLSLVPTDLDKEIDAESDQNSLLIRGESVLVNYVLVPLVLVYVLILHAYAAKIIVQWSLPKGEIGTIVTLFAAGGTLTWLLGWPWREKGTWLHTKFMNMWFWFLPVPAVLLTVAIAWRVADYGVTPERYGIAIVAVWTVLLFLYLLYRRNKADVRLPVISIAVLLLIGSFGPQGAYGVSANSQYARLLAVLERTGAVKEGAFVQKMPASETAAQNDAASIIYSLSEMRALDRVAALLPESDRPKNMQIGRYYSWEAATDLGQKLGANYTTSPNYFAFNITPPVRFEVGANSELAGPISAWSTSNATGSGPVVLAASLSGSKLKLTFDSTTNEYDVTELTKLILSQREVEQQNRKVLAYSLDSKSRLLVTDASVDTTGQPQLSSITFWVVRAK
jgi:hypothetical protein